MPNINRVGGGAGGGLKVSAKMLASLPAAGKENDIVVIDSGTAPAVVLDSTPPSNLAVNSAFVECGEHLSGKPTITISDSPPINLTLHTAYRKTASSLEAREGYVYKGGTYLKFSSRTTPGTKLPDPATTKVLIRDKNSTYYGAPIVWRLADKNHYAYDNNYPQNAITLISECILCFKPYDAAEPTNTKTAYKYGNSTYSKSNLLQWLNSDAAAGKWYIAKHTYDMPPATANLNKGNNPYDNEAGFLNGFSTQFKNALIATRHGTVLPQHETGDSEYVTSKIILPSVQEVGGPPMYLSVSAGLTIFRELGTGDSEKRYVTATPEALSHATTVVKPDSTTGSFHWWLRTPFNPESGWSGGADMRRVSGWDGSLTAGICKRQPYDGEDSGVRPMCNIPNTIQFVKANDGIYDIMW